MYIHTYMYIYVIDLLFMQRITIPEIKKHPWFLKNLPKDIMDAEKRSSKEPDIEQQSVEEIMRIIQEGEVPGEATKAESRTTILGSSDPDDDEETEDLELEAEIDNHSDDLVYPF